MDGGMFDALRTSLVVQCLLRWTSGRRGTGCRAEPIVMNGGRASGRKGIGRRAGLIQLRDSSPRKTLKSCR